MKFHPAHLLAPFLLAAFLPGCGEKESATAGSSAAPESTSTLATTTTDTSPHFERVMERLDVGGKMLHFEDHEGRREFLVSLIHAILENIPEAKGWENIDTAALVDASGLAKAAASGRSLRKDGESWLMRGYTHSPDGTGGLGGLIGKESVPFKGAALLPASTDLLIETRLDATGLPELIGKIGRACGREEAAKSVLEGPLPVGGDVGSLMAMIDLHIILAADVSSWGEKPLVPKPIDYFVRIEGGKRLLDALLPEIEKALGEPSAIGKRKGWEFPLPAIGMASKGVLAFDEAGTVILASRAPYLESIDEDGTKLLAEKDYQAATDHFPASGNFLLYTSPQIPGVLGWAIRQAAEGSDEEGAAALAKATEYLKPRALAFCFAREPDGLVLTAELPFAADTNLNSSLPLLTATSTLFIGARAWTKGSDRAACILNVRHAQQAVRSYQNMNGLEFGDPIPWGEKIYGEDGFISKAPVCSTGTYSYERNLPPVGTLACECSDPEHAVPNHADW